jgi:hypothetical protein
MPGTAEGEDGPGGDWPPSTQQRPQGIVRRLAALFAEALEAETNRWILWLPVFFAAGIALYFALPAEPETRVAAAFVLGAVGLFWFVRGSPFSLAFGVAVLAVSWLCGRQAANGTGPRACSSGRAPPRFHSRLRRNLRTPQGRPRPADVACPLDRVPRASPDAKARSREHLGQEDGCLSRRGRCLAGNVEPAAGACRPRRLRFRARGRRPWSGHAAAVNSQTPDGRRDPKGRDVSSDE